MPVQVLVTKAGRRIFRDARGRFISKVKYELERRRGPGGRFLTKTAAGRQRGVEQYLRAQLGAPPAGKTWMSIASKYPDRFTDYLEGLS